MSNQRFNLSGLLIHRNSSDLHHCIFCLSLCPAPPFIQSVYIISFTLSIPLIFLVLPHSHLLPPCGSEERDSWQQFRRIASGMDGKNGGEKRHEGSGFNLEKLNRREKREKETRAEGVRVRIWKTGRCTKRKRLSKSYLQLLCIPTNWLHFSILQWKAKIWFCRQMDNIVREFRKSFMGNRVMCPSLRGSIQRNPPFYSAIRLYMVHRTKFKYTARSEINLIKIIILKGGMQFRVLLFHLPWSPTLLV